jgi:protein ImuB
MPVLFACIHIPGATPPQEKSLLSLARAFSPEVEVAGQGTVVIEIASLEKLIGGPSVIASEMARRAHERQLAGRIGVAANPDTAILAARNLGGMAIIPAGTERQALAALPLAALRTESLAFSDDAVVVLEKWGIRTLAEFCALPEDGVVERLGTDAARLWRLARGEVIRPLRVEAEGTNYSEKLDLEHPVALLEPLLFLLTRLTHDLCGRLRSQSMATTEVRLTLELEDATRHTRILQLPFATRDQKAIVKLLELDLEAHPPRAPIKTLTLAVMPAEPRRIQNGLYEPPKPEPEKLELTLGKIRGLVGAGNVGSPELLDTHRRDAWRMRPSPVSPDGPAAMAPEKTRAGMRIAFRYFRPPRKARVETVEGKPGKVSGAGIYGKVTATSGPWKSSGDWWTDAAWAREEWDVALNDGAIYRLVSVAGAWLLEGTYD